MSLVAKSAGNGDFEIPPVGLYCAVCSKVEDVGQRETQFGPKDTVLIAWQLDERSPTTGKRFTVSSRFTISLHAKSVLSQRLESWFGRKFSDAERADGFNLEELVGKVCQVQIVHAAGRSGGTFANVDNIVLPPRGFTMEIEPDKDTPF